MLLRWQLHVGDFREAFDEAKHKDRNFVLVQHVGVVEVEQVEQDCIVIYCKEPYT